MKSIIQNFTNYLEEEGFYYIKFLGLEYDKLYFSCFEDDFEKLYIELLVDEETKDYVVNFRTEDSNIYLIYDILDKEYLNNDVM